MQVEGFTGPAGSDGSSVGMVEAVYSSKLIRLGGIAAEREGQMSGQVVITHPRLTPSPIRFVERPAALSFSGDSDTALMHRGV
jgi:hypothetical protein